MARKQKASVSMEQLVEVHQKFHPREKLLVVNTEIVPPSEAALVLAAPSATLKAFIERMVKEGVKERVDEIMAEREADQLTPTYQPGESNELRRQRTVFDRRKWGLYFEKWGCARCGKKNVNHASNGHCDACASLLTLRLIQIKLEYDRANPESQIAKDIDHLTRRVRSAEKLLGEGEE